MEGMKAGVKDTIADSETGFSVLIAEDNPVSRGLLEKTLEKTGYKVVVTRDGEEALNVFKQTFFPIVITDWMMPGMNGLELCEAIRGNASDGYVYIVFLTSKDSKDDIIAALSAGADDYLVKPFHKAELMARLRTGKRILDLERSLREANEDIKLLSITDPLTQVYNRGYVMSRLPEEIGRAQRYNHALSVIMCDIDHFKYVNDTLGHLVGDEVLKRVSQLLVDGIRNDVDWLARYGGEEFLIVLSETGTQGAVAVAERLRKALAEKTVDPEMENLHITASFGVVTYDPATVDRISPEDVIRQVDRHLYRAKELGRNRVVGGRLESPE
jgi:two-component system, cell cycle response regulator